MKEERQRKKPADGPHQKSRDERKINPTAEMKIHVRPSVAKDSVRLSRNGREQKSALTEVVGPTSSEMLPDPLKQIKAKEVDRQKKDRNEGNSLMALMNPKQRLSMKREEGTEQRKRMGPTFENKRSISHLGGTSRGSKKLPARGRAAAVEFPSRTTTSYTMTESTDESAGRMSLSSSTQLSRRTSQPSMRKKSLTHQYVQRKYSSSSSSFSSSSPRWLVSRPTSLLRLRRRAVREEPEKRGRLRRFKDKLAVIFHHHHHHHHHYNRNSSGESEGESPTTPSKDPHGRRGSMGKPYGKIYRRGAAQASSSAVIRAPRRREEHHHGHLYTLLQRLLRHIWHSRMMEEEKVGERTEIGKKSSMGVGVGRNGDKKMGRWQSAGGVKLGSRKKPRLVLGFPKAQRKTNRGLWDAKD